MNTDKPRCFAREASSSKGKPSFSLNKECLKYWEKSTNRVTELTKKINKILKETCGIDNIHDVVIAIKKDKKKNSKRHWWK